MTLNQAAKAAGKAKATLLAAIRAGRLSAPKDERGRYRIDPAELFRAYPPTSSPTSKLPVVETGTGHPRPAIEAAFFERIIAGLESERDDLRRRLDQSEAERREAQARLAALLTHQPPAEPPPAPPAPPAPGQGPRKRGAWLPWRSRK